jgi:hypothetical protein
MYANTQAAGPTPGAGESTESSDDDVVDAEIVDEGDGSGSES